MAEPRDPREPRIPKESPPFDADNKWTRTWIMYFESLFDLSVKEAVRQAGTVTHTGGDLTKDLPVFGNDKDDIKVGTKSGNTNEVATVSGATVTGNTVKWDANGNLINAGVAPGGGTVTAVTGTPPIASSGGTTPAISIAAFTGDSGSGGAKGAVPAPAAGDAAAGKVLGAGGGWVAGGAGTVTHTGGALTADQPVFGAGGADIKVGTKTGNTDKVATSTGSIVTGNTVKWDANGNLIDAGATPGTGTVTSVALTVPAEFSVSGSPVTTSGTLAVSKATQSANTVFAGPTTGSAAAPTFRALVSADIPGGGGGSSLITAPPLVSSLTWMNQSTSTAVDAANGIFLTQPFGATQYIAALVQNAPATPWTFTAGLMMALFTVNFQSCGIQVSDGTKITALRLQYNSSAGGNSFQLDDFTSATVYTANLAASSVFATLPFPLWLRVADNGTNIIWSYSVDGVNFLQLFSRTRTTFQTPTKFGICSVAQNSSRDVNFTCVSWKVS
jgi:hypothetical protein